MTNNRITPEAPTPAQTVNLNLKVVTYYKDNDIYNTVYYGFLIAAAVIFFIMLVFLIALKCLRN